MGPRLPGTLGMNGAPRDVLVCRWNSPEALEQCLKDHADQVAAVIMEPVMGNGGVIAPEPDFLDNVRAMTKDHEALLIFDEVITGMRVAAGGAQQRFGVEADITILSKALGGGFPISALGSTQEIMQSIVEGKLFHGGVYSGNTLVMAAADAVLDEMHRDRRRHLHASRRHFRPAWRRHRRDSYPVGRSASGTIRWPDDFDVPDARRCRSVAELSRRAATLRL